MSLEIRPLEPADWPTAGRLLAARHAHSRRSEPELPEQYEQPDQAEALLASLLAQPNAKGVIACWDGRPAGFMAGYTFTVSPFSMNAKYVRSRAAWLPYEGYALDDADDGELYREMYAALASQWIKSGHFSHYVETPALDVTVADAFHSLGFGRQTTVALRRVSEPVEPEQDEVPNKTHDGVTIERAGPEISIRLSD